MTLNEYIEALEEDIEMLENEDTELYGCCDMAEHNVYLEMSEMVLENLKRIKENQNALVNSGT